jgi:hypothetical protein
VRKFLLKEVEMNKQEFLEMANDETNRDITESTIDGVMNFLYSGRHRHSGKMFMCTKLKEDDNNVINFCYIRERDLEYFLEDYDCIKLDEKSTIFKRNTNVSRYDKNNEGFLVMETEEEKEKLKILSEKMIKDFKGMFDAAS